MKIIDAHLHLWDISWLHYPWLDIVPGIRRNFLIDDYKKSCNGFDIEAMIFVQCECIPREAIAELDFVMEQAKADNRIKGIVAYAALEKGYELEGYIQMLKRNPLIRGVRRMTEQEPGLCLSKKFSEATDLLAKNDLSLDLSIKPFQAEETIAMIERNPENKFILDHLGKPGIKNDGFGEYKKYISRFAQFPNLGAKLSGLITEADWQNWNIDTIRPYFEFAVEKFGTKRLVFGSDWPVVLLAGSLKEWLHAALELASNCTQQERDDLFYNNAKKYYGI